MKNKDGSIDKAVGELQSSTARHDQGGDIFSDICRFFPMGIYIVQGGKFRYANPLFQTMTGYAEDELLGMDPLTLIPREERDVVRRNAKRMLKGEGRVPFEHGVLTKSGQTRWVMETVSLVSHKGKRAALGGVLDITDRERAKEGLRLSGDRFYAAFRSSPDWVVITTIEDGFFVDINDAFLRMSGYRREEVVGRTSMELGIWVDTRKRADAVKALRETGAVRNQEVRFRMKTGEIRNMLWSAEMISFGGEPCMIAVAHDITERMRAEEERLRQERMKGPATLVTQIGLTMVGSILFCFAIGYYLDKWLGTKGLFITILIVLGVVGGGYNAYRQIMETTGLDIKRKGKDE